MRTIGYDNDPKVIKCFLSLLIHSQRELVAHYIYVFWLLIAIDNESGQKRGDNNHNYNKKINNQNDLIMNIQTQKGSWWCNKN